MQTQTQLTQVFKKENIYSMSTSQMCGYYSAVHIYCICVKVNRFLTRSYRLTLQIKVFQMLCSLRTLRRHF